MVSQITTKVLISSRTSKNAWISSVEEGKPSPSFEVFEHRTTTYVGRCSVRPSVFEAGLRSSPLERAVRNFRAVSASLVEPDYLIFRIVHSEQVSKSSASLAVCPFEYPKLIQRLGSLYRDGSRPALPIPDDSGGRTSPSRTGSEEVGELVPGSAFFTSNLTVTASAFAATNPTDELVASGLSTVKFAGTCLVSLNQNRTWRFLLRPAFA